MTKPLARDLMYRKRAFDAEIIELGVRWYITYRLSYRESGGNDGQARRQGRPLDDSSMGDPARARVREATWRRKNKCAGQTALTRWHWLECQI